MIWFVHIPSTVMSFMISIISTAESIVPDIELFEWGRSTIALHSNAGGSTISCIFVYASSATVSMSLSNLYHSKTVDTASGVLPMKFKMWWYPLEGGVMLHCGLCSSWHV